MKNVRLKGLQAYVLPVLLYSLAIYLISSLSDPPAPDFHLEWGDKINHAGAFGLMMLLAFRATRWLYPRHSLGAQILIGLAWCILYGLTDEIHQSFVPNRHCDPFDLLADTIGALLGALFILGTHRSTIGRIIFGPAATRQG